MTAPTAIPRGHASLVSAVVRSMLRTDPGPSLDLERRTTMTVQNPLTARQPSGSPELHEGDDLVCPTCGAEIRIRHTGDSSKARSMATFTCRCGTSMQHERQTGA
jgi:hypothetical protein